MTSENRGKSADLEPAGPQEVADPMEERRRYALRDLEELDEQLAAGELDEATAARLRAGYEAELHAVAQSRVEEAGEPPGRERSSRRTTAGALLLVGAFTVVILLAAQTFGSGGDSSPQAPSDAAATDAGSLQQMEDIIASHPDSPGLRLAAADLYFEQGNYSSAIGHYLAAAEGELTPEEESRALGRIGWMAYSTGQLEAAVEYLHAGLEADPDYNEGKLFLAMVLFEGFGDPAGAIPLFEEILELPDLHEEMRSAVEGAVAEARTALESP